jgi:hypothetical protein
MPLPGPEPASRTEPFLPRRIADLDEPGLLTDQAFRVEGARVVFADRDLLRRDFPFLERMAPEDLDEWLLRHAALVSTAQAGQRVVNTPVRVVGEPLEVYRPPRYGRAFIAPVPGEGGEPAGLLDLKGVGVRAGVTPRASVHGDGLFILGEALEEYMTQLLIEAIFRHGGEPFSTLPVYAVLDLGFNAISSEIQHPAAALVRRAHRRNPGNVEVPLCGSPEQKLHLRIELLLRHYGVTSANPGSSYEFTQDEDGTVRCLFAGGPANNHNEEQLLGLWKKIGTAKFRRFEGINIQTVRGEGVTEVQLLDFGQYKIRDGFSDPLLSMVANRPFAWGGSIAPDHPLFVQPDPHLAVSTADWGDAELSAEEAAALGIRPGEALSRKEELGLRLARDFREGRKTGAEVRAAIGDLIEKTVARWP